MDDAGVDYVVVDMTNLPQYDQTADAIQLRPFEIMCEVIIYYILNENYFRSKVVRSRYRTLSQFITFLIAVLHKYTTLLFQP